MNTVLPAKSELGQPNHLATHMFDEEAKRIIVSIGIPPCPTILTKLLREMREDDPDFSSIGRLLSSDVSLAASMLKTVNSPFYGLPCKVSSVQQALMLLGLQNVARLTTGLLLRQAFPISKGEVMDTFWATSARVASATALFARELKCADRDEAYTFGLFRDCGMLLMACKYSDYDQILKRTNAPSGGALIDIEEEEYGVHHAVVGFHMATNWYLSEDLCQAILHHHDIHALDNVSGIANEHVRRLIALGWVAERIDNQPHNQSIIDDWSDIAADIQPATRELGLDASNLAKLAKCLHDSKHDN